MKHIEPFAENMSTKRQGTESTMALTVRESCSFEALGQQAWNALLARDPGATVFQSWEWLTAWWHSQPKGALWLLSAWDRGELVGVAPLFVDSTGTVRFVGEEDADYGEFICCARREDVFDALLNYIFGKSSCWEALSLACVLSSSKLAHKLQERGAWPVARMPCPKVSFLERSADSLLAKESLRRHAKKLRARGHVEVRHFDSAETIEPWLAAFFRQHQERWAITHTPSMFSKSQNRTFYQELAAQARTGGPVLLTVVLLDGKPAAMHMGLRSQGGLIWYKPTYDPCFASAGPGEVLLAEIIRKAQDEGANGLDFTRGDEKFKMRFASELREVVTFNARSTMIRRIAERTKEQLWRMAKVSIEVCGLHAPAAAVLHDVQAAYRISRERGVRAAWQTANEHLKKHGAVHVALYVRATAPISQDSTASISVRCTSELSEILQLFDLDDREHLAVLADVPMYLQAGARLWVAQCEGAVVSCGWEMRGTGINVTEIGARLEFPADVALLMEFQTFSRYRRCGYYAALLQNIGMRTGITQHLIYALTDNVGSIRAIERSGFEPLGLMSRSVAGMLYFRPLRTNPAVSVHSLGARRIRAI